MSLSTPRILPEHLAHFAAPGGATAGLPSTVRLLGTVSGLYGDMATVTCGGGGGSGGGSGSGGGGGQPHGEVRLRMNPDTKLEMGRLVDVVGKVVGGPDGLAVRILGSVDVGDPKDFDYKIYEAVVDVTHRYKSLFY